MTNKKEIQGYELTPQGLQNLVGFFRVLDEVHQENILKKRLSSYSFHTKNAPNSKGEKAFFDEKS